MVNIAQTNLQLPIRQWGASNVYLLVLSSWKVKIAENSIAVGCRSIRQAWLAWLNFKHFLLTYLRVASSYTSRLAFTDCLWRGILEAYVLWPFDKKSNFWINNTHHTLILATLRYLSYLIFWPNVEIPALVQFGETCVFVAILSSI